MSNDASDIRNEYASTYFVQDRTNRDEMTRLALQDQAITTGMGGVLPEQADLSSFQRVLDIGCGTGGWLIEYAKASPVTTQLFGIDANQHMLTYAREQARQARVDARIKFQVMDALLILAFPQHYFDLVNVRFATSYMRTWDWPKLIGELRRITRPGGVIRLTEYERVTSSSTALIRILKMAGEAFYRSGHLFAEGVTEGTSSTGTLGIAKDLAPLLSQYGAKQVQTRPSSQELSTGAPGSESFVEGLSLGLRTIVPFLRKWGCLSEDYDVLYQRMLNEMHQPEHSASWSLITAWGRS